MRKLAKELIKLTKQNKIRWEPRTSVWEEWCCKRNDATIVLLRKSVWDYTLKFFVEHPLSDDFVVCYNNDSTFFNVLDTLSVVVRRQYAASVVNKLQDVDPQGLSSEEELEGFRKVAQKLEAMDEELKKFAP